MRNYALIICLKIDLLTVSTFFETKTNITKEGNNYSSYILLTMRKPLAVDYIVYFIFSDDFQKTQVYLRSYFTGSFL